VLKSDRTQPVGGPPNTPFDDLRGMPIASAERQLVKDWQNGENGSAIDAAACQAFGGQ
jgi:hypothetical protein